MKRFSTYDDFLFENFDFRFGAVKDASKKFSLAIKQLEEHGYRLWNSDSSSHPTGDTSNTELIYVKPGEPKSVKISLYIGRTAKQNSFYSSLGEVPAEVTSEKIAGDILKDKNSSKIDITSAAKFLKDLYREEVEKIAEKVSTLTREEAERCSEFRAFAEKRGWDLKTNMWYLYFNTEDPIASNLGSQISTSYKSNHRIGYIDFKYPDNVKGSVEDALSDISQFPVNVARHIFKLNRPK